MIARNIAGKIIDLHKKYPVIALTGARQTGKTTLLKSIFNDLPYINLEDLDNRTLAETDPRGFLSNFPNGAVIDEVQQVPQLFSYIQQIVDNQDIRFVLSGSQNFQLLENITQSLAGRTAVLSLMPLSLSELANSGYVFESFEDIVFKGFYPRMFDKDIPATDFFPYYINTYIERDVRQIKNIENISLFSNFLQLCAGRIGQILNLQSLANDIGISPNTVKAWITVLEASYILYLHKPHFNNLNKRIIKSPKIYFYDTGLACSLLQINSPQQLKTHYLKGGLFENFVINEISKYYWNKGIKPPVYFWQNKHKKEIDLIIDKGVVSYPIEIKAAKTKNISLLENLAYWNKLTPTSSNFLNLIYGGDENFKTSQGNFVSWQNIDTFKDELNIRE